MRHKAAAIGLGWACVWVACAAALGGCPWGGLSYLVDGPDTGTPDAGDAGDAALPDAPDHFATLAPRASLPSESVCAAWINAHPAKEYVSANGGANQTPPTAAWLDAFHDNPLSTCSGSSWTDLGG